ncbi:hypothetical protein PT974_12510 [Cladobotryum mycophilum]|uniref:Terpenoid synthase n=1 Tax=Cladobotryum mycophilum TaxID=491253 RepID=A0ABR0S865_9HYPO
MALSTPYVVEVPNHLKIWTSCPLRVSAHEPLAYQATLDMLQEWKDHNLPTIPDVHLKLSASRYGHLIACMSPEALPDRIGPFTKIIDLFLLADEIMEGPDTAKTEAAMEDLSSAAPVGPDASGLKVNLAYVEKEILESDPVLGGNYMHEMKNYWHLHKTFSLEIYQHTHSFSAFIPFRYCNFAGPTLRHMLCFSAGQNLTEYDIRALELPIFAATIAAILWNDLYS